MMRQLGLIRLYAAPSYLNQSFVWPQIFITVRLRTPVHWRLSINSFETSSNHLLCNLRSSKSATKFELTKNWTTSFMTTDPSQNQFIVTIVSIMDSPRGQLSFLSTSRAPENKEPSLSQMILNLSSSLRMSLDRLLIKPCKAKRKELSSLSQNKN